MCVWEPDAGKQTTVTLTSTGSINPTTFCITHSTACHGGSGGGHSAVVTGTGKDGKYTREI